MLDWNTGISGFPKDQSIKPVTSSEVFKFRVSYLANWKRIKIVLYFICCPPKTFYYIGCLVCFRFYGMWCLWTLLGSYRAPNMTMVMREKTTLLIDDSVVRRKRKDCTCEKYLRGLFSKGVCRPEKASVQIEGLKSVTNSEQSKWSNCKI